MTKLVNENLGLLKLMLHLFRCKIFYIHEKILKKILQVNIFRKIFLSVWIDLNVLENANTNQQPPTTANPITTVTICHLNHKSKRKNQQKLANHRSAPCHHYPQTHPATHRNPQAIPETQIVKERKTHSLSTIPDQRS